MAGSAGDLGVVQAAGAGETRRSEVAAQAERHHHPRRLEEEAAGAMIATVKMIRAIDRPTGAGRVADSAGDLEAVQAVQVVRAAEADETRRSEVAARAERHRHPRRLEAEAASEPVGHRWMVSGGLPKG